MNTKGKQEFAELVTGIAEVYGQPITQAGLRIWWGALEDYELAQVQAAFTAHSKDTERGTFMPRPADIVRQIDGEKPTTDQIIAAAMKPRTALAVLCRMEIGCWNLDNWDRFKLAPLAESCIAQIPEWKQRIESGKLTDHESMALTKYGVNPQTYHLTEPREIVQNNC